MDVSRFRKVTKKPVLWIAAINTVILLISLLIISQLALTLIVKIILVSQIILDLIIINSAIGIMNFGKTSIALLYVGHYDIDEKSNKAVSVVYKRSRYCWWISSIISIVTFFILISSAALAAKISWGDAFVWHWPLALTLSIINFTLMNLNFSLTIYLINQSSTLISNSLEWRNKFHDQKKQRETKKLETEPDLEDK
ncbi:hypothetical protein [Spiroplasma endosymbiont of Panorpa germanica]|uniref:hypothetical protein n=1 Tax=Spiroplasma endosymbiont of Panorpa germanica TaxID=3066314 RepID=UPI0030D18E32